MTDIIHISSGRTGYEEVVKHVYQYGEPRKPRGLDTFDAGHTVVVLETPYDSLPVGVGRDINVKIAAAEAIQLVGGFTDPEFMFNIAPQFRHYAEDEGFFHGAYGRRIGTQLRDVVHKLKSDQDSRQAVLTLWDPLLDNYAGKRDYPCTVAIGFGIGRRGRLDMNVTMRSNDVWLGLPYDLFQFSQLMLTVCNAMDAPPGTYTHTAWSMHLYARDVEKVLALGSPESAVLDQPQGFGRAGENITTITTRAHRIHYHGASLTDELTESEEWYRDNLYR